VSSSNDVVEELRPPQRPVDLTEPLAIHIVGIGGAGMRAIARILLAMGHKVSGSDRTTSKFLTELEQMGATVFVGHAGEQSAGADLLTRSTAVPDNNPEVAAALAGGIAVYSRAEILAAITAVRPAILIAGTHGKTTTSSMLAVVLEHAGMSPSFAIGSDVAFFGSGARWESGEAFVVEADESDGTFLALAGAHAVVTSLDPDHLEFYGTPERLISAFEGFVDATPGTIAVCIDDPDTQSLVGRPGVITYGTKQHADLCISSVEVGADTTEFDTTWRGEKIGRVSVGLPGLHNALNAAAALTMAMQLGVGFQVAAEGLARFAGVARRFETRGNQRGVRFVDDYAHLPAEVEAMVATAKSGPWNRVIAAYQPHRFSRTEALGATFAESFRGVDHLVLTDIYPSGEAPRDGVTGRIVLDAVQQACPELSVSWQPTLDDVARYLATKVGPGDLCLTLGAGDLTTVPDVVVRLLAEESNVSVSWLRESADHLTSSTVRFNESIGALTTYRVGGAALAVAEVGSSDDLSSLVAGAVANRTPILPIGKGSNMLIADRGFGGVALVLAGDFDAVEIDGTMVRLGASVSLPVAARQLTRSGLAGFEWAVGVPGTVGGAIAMNAGGHGSDMAATVVEATVLDLTSGATRVLSAAELGFGYRQSNIAATDLVVDATMELVTDDSDEGGAVLTEIVRWRREHQPGGQNAGSVFTNPHGDSAGRLIDAAGGKGLRLGTAHVSEKHANFIQVEPDGSADDIYRLMHLIVELVRETFSIDLEPETRMVGFAPFGTWLTQ